MASAPEAESPALGLDVDDAEAAKLLATHDPLAPRWPSSCKASRPSRSALKALPHDLGASSRKRGDPRGFRGRLSFLTLRDRRLQAIFLRNGRLSRLSFEGPRFAMRRLYVPASEATFRSFDWMHDQRLPEISFETDPEKRRVLLVNHPSGSTARFVRE
jgi:hypothetical protein